MITLDQLKKYKLAKCLAILYFLEPIAENYQEWREWLNHVEIDTDIASTIAAMKQALDLMTVSQKLDLARTLAAMKQAREANPDDAGLYAAQKAELVNILRGMLGAVE